MIYSTSVSTAGVSYLNTYTLAIQSAKEFIRVLQQIMRAMSLD